MWTRVHELLAGMMEVTSVTASGKRLKQELKVPRPVVHSSKDAEQRARIEYARGAISVDQAIAKAAGQGKVQYVGSRG